MALLGALSLLAVSFIFVSAPARAEIAELPSLEGCFDTVAGAVGLFGGEQTPASGIQLDVPGPVATAIVEWVGQDPAASGDSSLDLSLSGPDGTATGTFPGTLSATDSALGKPLFSWYADVTDLFGAGTPGAYAVDVTPFAVPGAGFAWGATLTVVYDTSPCDPESILSWKVGTDYYWGGGSAVPSRTDVMVYEFAPSTVDRIAEIRASHGGADSDAPGCRVSAFWATTGSGPAPGPGDDLVDAAGDPVFPGATEIAVAPFSPEPQGCPDPVPVLPLVSITGGNVGPEYALVEMEFLVPAGAAWIALQLESPPDNGGYSGIPESGAWAGGGAFVLAEAGVDPVAGIVLEKTVLPGSGVCPGVEGSDELVVGEVGSVVTYCYRVVNVGESALLPVLVDDPSLGISVGDMTLVSGDPSVPLASGDVLVYSFETSIDGPLTGVAVTEGIPVEDDGTPIGDLDPVTDSNDAGVDVPGVGDIPVAGIVLEKTVLPGSGVCPGVEGSDELVVGEVGSVVTYCYRVVNVGESALLPVLVDDPSLGISVGDMTLVSGDPSVPLASGDVLVYSFETSIDGPLTGVAVTEGIPVEDDGTPIGDLDPVTDSNDAGVDVPGVGDIPVAGIVLEKTVLPGSGVCPGVEGSDELRRTVAGSESVFCYRIINTGATALFPVTLVDPDLGVTEADLVVQTGTLISPLMPGEEIVALLPVVDIEGVSMATATGDPSSDSGVALGFDPVVSSNDAGIELQAAAVMLEKTVLLGHDAACAGVESTDELITALAGTPVTFCFRVVNTGSADLYPVEIADPTLGITSSEMTLVSGDPTGPLAPGDELVYSYNHSIVASVRNVATVTATPAGPDGGATAAEVLVASNDARVAILQETLPRTGSALYAQVQLGLMLLLAGLITVAATQIFGQTGRR